MKDGCEYKLFVMFAYLLMIYAGLSHFLLQDYAKVFRTDAKRLPFDIFETIIYSLLSVMMVWSQITVMIADPGKIPRAYQYEEEKIPEKYRKKVIPESSPHEISGTSLINRELLELVM